MQDKAFVVFKERALWTLTLSICSFKAVSSFKDIVPSVETMQEIHQAGDLKQLKEVAKAYQALDKALGSIQVYD